MENIFISPHFDDAVGSCGGLIQSLNDVVICTIFTKQYRGRISQVAKDLHKDWNLKNAVKSRKKENERACKALKVKAVNLNFLEMLYRKDKNGYVCKTFQGLFGENYNYEIEFEKQLLSAIKKKFSKSSNFYFPMSMGTHVDHVLLHNVGIKLSEEGYHIKFYQDFSYELNKEVKGFQTFKFYYDKKILDKKIEASMCYASQMPDLFGSIDKAKEYFYSFKEGGMFYENYYVKL